MKIRNKGAVLLQIALLFISQHRSQNQSTDCALKKWKLVRSWLIRQADQSLEKCDPAAGLSPK